MEIHQSLGGAPHDLQPFLKKKRETRVLPFIKKERKQAQRVTTTNPWTNPDRETTYQQNKRTTKSTHKSITGTATKRLKLNTIKQKDQKRQKAA
jgi:hypothetical protein